jgi:hypothetical protein
MKEMKCCTSEKKKKNFVIPETRILENAELSKGILSAEASFLKCRLKYEIRFIVIENQELTLN